MEKHDDITVFTTEEMLTMAETASNQTVKPDPKKLTMKREFSISTFRPWNKPNLNKGN